MLRWKIVYSTATRFSDVSFEITPNKLNEGGNKKATFLNLKMS